MDTSAGTLASCSANSNIASKKKERTAPGLVVNSNLSILTSLRTPTANKCTNKYDKACGKDNDNHRRNATCSTILFNMMGCRQVYATELQQHGAIRQGGCDASEGEQGAGCVGVEGFFVRELSCEMQGLGTGISPKTAACSLRSPEQLGIRLASKGKYSAEPKTCKTTKFSVVSASHRRLAKHPDS